MKNLTEKLRSGLDLTATDISHGRTGRRYPGRFVLHFLQEGLEFALFNLRDQFRVIRRDP